MTKMRWLCPHSALSFAIALCGVTYVSACGFAYPARTNPLLLLSNNFPNAPTFLKNCYNDIFMDQTFIGTHYLEITWNYFNLGSTMPACKDNYVEIFIGGSTIGRFCGTTTPHPIVSLDDVVRISLTSDGTTSGPGFNLTYAMKSIASQPLVGGKDQACSSLSTSTGGLLFGEPWPSRQYEDITCTYTLEPTAGYTARIAIMSTNMRQIQSGPCENYLRIEGSAQGMPTLLYTKMCGEIGGTAVQSNDDKITVSVRFAKEPHNYHGFIVGFVTFPSSVLPTASTSDSGTSTGSILIGVGVAVGLCLVLMFYMLWKRRRVVSSGVPCPASHLQGTVVIRCPDRQSQGATQERTPQARAPPSYLESVSSPANNAETEEPPPPYTPIADQVFAVENGGRRQDSTVIPSSTQHT